MAPLVAGGGDLAKLKSLLYERIGQSRYTGWIPTGFFKTPAPVQISRFIFYFFFPLFFYLTGKREPSKLVRRLDRSDFEGLSNPAIIKFPRWEIRTVVRDVIVVRLNTRSYYQNCTIIMYQF